MQHVRAFFKKQFEKVFGITFVSIAPGDLAAALETFALTTI
jgi:hypothetical protein